MRKKMINLPIHLTNKYLIDALMVHKYLRFLQQFLVAFLQLNDLM